MFTVVKNDTEFLNFAHSLGAEDKAVMQLDELSPEKALEIFDFFMFKKGRNAAWPQRRLHVTAQRHDDGRHPATNHYRRPRFRRRRVGWAGWNNDHRHR